MMVSFPASEQNGEKSKTRTLKTILEQIQKQLFFLVFAALNMKNVTRENQDCSDAPKGCACVVKFISVAMVKVKSISLAVKD